MDAMLQALLQQSPTSTPSPPSHQLLPTIQEHCEYTCDEHYKKQQLYPYMMRCARVLLASVLVLALLAPQRNDNINHLDHHNVKDNAWWESQAQSQAQMVPQPTHTQDTSSVSLSSEPLRQLRGSLSVQAQQQQEQAEQQQKEPPQRHVHESESPSYRLVDSFLSSQSPLSQTEDKIVSTEKDSHYDDNPLPSLEEPLAQQDNIDDNDEGNVAFSEQRGLTISNQEERNPASTVEGTPAVHYYDDSSSNHDNNNKVEVTTTTTDQSDKDETFLVPPM